MVEIIVYQVHKFRGEEEIARASAETPDDAIFAASTMITEARTGIQGEKFVARFYIDGKLQGEMDR